MGYFDASDGYYFLSVIFSSKWEYTRTPDSFGVKLEGDHRYVVDWVHVDSSRNSVSFKVIDIATQETIQRLEIIDDRPTVNDLVEEFLREMKEDSNEK